MKLGILLLSLNGVYIDNDGELPTRPEWDKQFLLDLCTGHNIICSTNTRATLPKSLINKCKSVKTSGDHFDINLGIDSFKADVDLLIIVRSNEFLNGKAFSLNKYKEILQREGIELWILKR